LAQNAGETWALAATTGDELLFVLLRAVALVMLVVAVRQALRRRR
jgi:hypothetical protein